MMRLTLLLSCLLALHGVSSVPSTLQPSCGTELVTVELEGSLKLTCGSHCQKKDESFTWWKIGRNRYREELSFTGDTVIEDRVTPGSGGEYECKCGETGQECTFYVAVIPTVTFTASQTATHYGDVVTLTCVMEGSPSNYTSIYNRFGIPLSPQKRRKVNTHRLETSATVRDIEEEDYVCEVETHYKGRPIAHRKLDLKVELYSPPSILYTTEYVLHEEAEFGQPGHLSCVVQTPPDTECHVTWWVAGKQVREGGKYRMTSSEESGDVTVFRLEIEAVEQSDIRAYLCQLSSQYNVEETQEAWIKVDYRRESGRGGGATRDGGGSAGVLSQVSTRPLRSICVVACLVMVVGLGTWGVVLRRRSQKRRRWGDGIIGRGQQGLLLSSSQSLAPRQPVGQSSVSVFKRK